MKLRTLILALCLLAAGTARGQTILSILTTTGNTGTLTTAGTNTTGATFIAVVFVDISHGTKPAISDSYSNVWNILPIVGSNTAVNFYPGANIAWTSAAVNGGILNVGTGHTFTLTGFSTLAYLNVMVFKNYTPVLQTATGWQNSTTLTASIQPGSITPSGTGALFITGAAAYESTSISPTSSFTLSSTAAFSSSTNYASGAAYMALGSSTAAQNPVWSGITGSNYPAAISACFIPAPTGGSTGEVVNFLGQTSSGAGSVTGGTLNLSCGSTGYTSGGTLNVSAGSNTISTALLGFSGSGTYNVTELNPGVVSYGTSWGPALALAGTLSASAATGNAGPGDVWSGVTFSSASYAGATGTLSIAGSQLVAGNTIHGVAGTYWPHWYAMAAMGSLAAGAYAVRRFRRRGK